jgi:hypothetical protein
VAINHHENALSSPWCGCLCTLLVMCQFEVLWASVEGPCLHRPENWLVGQLIDEPKPGYKVGFIREKGKATAEVVRQSPETGSSLLR